MKISNDTKDVLKNFSTINSGIRVKTGNKLETISNMKNILAVATVAEDFPQDFSIYNLPEFLGATSLMDDPDFQFNDSSLSVADNNSSLSYFYAAFLRSVNNVDVTLNSISASGIVIIFSGAVTIPSAA